MADFILSVLDQAPISEGMSGAQALRNSIDLARNAERLGYHRYWVAEHHGTPALACASPEALIGPIATATSTIRVGSGGVMLPHYSPLRVAESFSMLSGITPGRIDLAVGRAAGTDPVTAFALQRDRRQAAPDDFPAQLVELMSYLDDDMPADHPFARLTQLPGRPELPELWLLGSSAQSGLWAAELGLPYAFADFINPKGGEIAARYRETFQPSRRAEKPRMTVAVWAICADTDEEAVRLASSARMMFTLFFRGQLIPIPPIDVAMRFLEDQPPPSQERRTIVGSPATVRSGIEAAVQEYGADEAMVVTITYDHAARVRSYELIAGAFA
ncbi:MAG TPA: LLM class flavin-dependent oxidoreductase [Thermoanaerobaculia bacterium]|nr:LLM class flavin-dependent oxidoreductase [Thermoanaerobaculia bacterium]